MVKTAFGRTGAATAQRITRDDLERRFSALQDDLKGKVADRKQTLISAAGALVVVLLLVAFVLGKRSGRRKTTLVEIRRV